MKNIQFFLLTIIIIALTSCHNQETTYKLEAFKITDPLNNEFFSLKDSGKVYIKNKKWATLDEKGVLKNNDGKVLLFFSGDTLKDETKTNLAVINKVN